MPTPFTMPIDATWGLGDYFGPGTLYQKGRAVEIDAVTFKISWYYDALGTTCYDHVVKSPQLVRWSILPPIRNFGTFGTLRLVIDPEADAARGPQIEQYDSVVMVWSDGLDNFNYAHTIYLPAITSAVATLWVDTEGRTYTDANLTTLACGKFGSQTIIDSYSLSDIVPKTGYRNLWDQLALSDNMQFNPRHLRDQLKLTDSITIESARHGTVVGWQFAPLYKVFYDEEGNGTYATTSWDSRVLSYGRLRKSVKHWTGDFQVGNCSLEMADEDNSLWGSLYGGGTNEGRYKEVHIRAMINDRPLQFYPQFAGEIQKTTWVSGIAELDLKDRMRGLPNREFVFD